MNEWTKRIGMMAGYAMSAFVVSLFTSDCRAEETAKTVVINAVSKAEEEADASKLRAEEAEIRADDAEEALAKHKSGNAEAYGITAASLNALREEVDAMGKNVKDCMETIPRVEMLMEDAFRRMGKKTVERRVDRYIPHDYPSPGDARPDPLTQKLNNAVDIAVDKARMEGKSADLPRKGRVPSSFELYE